MDKIINLRAHHLLCSVLFEGKGYSDAFTENMTLIVDEILEKNNYLQLQKSKDIICTDCPNLKSDGGCKLDDKIPDLDKKILDYFELPMDKKIYSADIFKIIKENITPEFFASCCNECRWSKMGICTYEKYIKNINRFA